MNFAINQSDNILVIASMPEDISIACGGFICKYNKQIDILCINYGKYFPDVPNTKSFQTLHDEFSILSQKANVKNIFIEDYFNPSEFDIKSYDIILIPHKEDNTPEHKFIGDTYLKNLLTEKGHKDNLQIIRYELWNPMKEANYYEDITNYIDAKRELIISHKKNEGPNFAERILSNNKFRTFTSPYSGIATHVEAFFVDDLYAYLEKPDIIDKNTDIDFRNEEIETFLINNDAQTKINKLAERLNNKKIVLFGAGDFTRCVFKNYDLSKLDIIAISDKRFEQGRVHKFYELNCIKPQELNNINADVLLIAEQDFIKNYDLLINTILNNTNLKIEPLIQTDLHSYLKINCENKICTRPFHTLSIVPTGHCITCCPAYIKNYTIGNVFREDFESLWRGNRAEYLREALKRGDYTTCDLNTCITLELADKTDIAKYYEKDGNTIKMPDTIFMSWDYDCNVACITCRNQIIKNNENTLKALQSIEKSVLEACKNAKLFYTSGNGDPFGSSYARNLIKKVVEINPQIKFLIHTNGVLCNKKICDELNITDKIKDITFSIHASCKETYDKIVRFGNFDKVLQNLNWLSSMKSEGKIENIYLVFVVHKLNYKDMPDFVRMAEKYNATASFRYYRQWANNTEYNYEDMAIFEKTHPEYSQFEEVLQDKIFDSPHCILDPSLKIIHNMSH